MKKGRALVLVAPGTNRDRDVVFALELAGMSTDSLPLARLVGEGKSLLDYSLLVLPGGFSYGDALGAGSLLALDLRKRFAEELGAFVASGRMLLGICNGFQALVKAGILPGADIQEPRRRVTLAANEGGRFECRWVELAAPPSRCLWTEGLELGISCPIAHGEGRLAVDSEETAGLLESEGHVALVYAEGRPGEGGVRAGGRWPANPNGSVRDIAGLCNAEGNVLGLMPHPENALVERNYRGLAGRGGPGARKLFENGVRRAGS